MTWMSYTWYPPHEEDEKEKKKKKTKSVRVLPTKIVNPEEFVTVKGKPPAPPAIAYPQVPTGKVIPYVIGRQRIFEPGVLWYGSLKAKYHIEKEVVGTEIKEVTESVYDEYTNVLSELYVYKTPVTTVMETRVVEGYTLDVQMGLCLGDGVHLLEIYVDGAKKWEGDASGAKTVLGEDDINESDFWATWTFYDGRFDQEPAEEILSGTTPAYVGIACVTLKGANATETFPPISFEVGRWPNHLGLDDAVNKNSAGDINPMTALYDVVVNDWGGSGVNATRIDSVSFTAAAIRLASEGIFISVIRQDGGVNAAQIIDQIEDLCYGVCFVDPATNTMKFRLIRYDLYDIDALQALDESNTTELRGFRKSSWEGAATRGIATFTSRQAEYSDDYVFAELPVVTGANRDIKSMGYSYPLAMTGEVAAVALARDMTLINQPCASCEARCNRVMSDALPGDAVLVSWSEYGVYNLPMVVTRCKEVDDGIGVIVTLTQLIDINSEVIFSVPEPSLFDPPNKEPVSPVSAKVISAPYWIQARAYDDFWGKEIKTCTPIYLVEPFNTLQVSFDVRMLNYPDQPSPVVGDQPVINREALFATVGYLTSAMSATAGFSDGIINEVLINGVVFDAYMRSPGLSGVKAGELFMFVDGEILSFEQAEDEGAGVWKLTNVHRGLLDTVARAHSLGAKVWIVNGRWSDRLGMSFDIVPDYIPELRFCSRTLKKKQADEGLEYADWTPSNRVNRPLPPMDTRIDGVRSATPFDLNVLDVVTVSWKTRSRNKIKKVPVFADDSHAPEVSQNGTWQKHRVWLTDYAGNDFNLGHTTASGDYDSLDVTIPMGAVSGPGFIWVQSYNDFGNANQAEMYPVLISGVYTPSNVLTDHLGDPITDHLGDPITDNT